MASSIEQVKATRNPQENRTVSRIESAPALDHHDFSSITIAPQAQLGQTPKLTGQHATPDLVDEAIQAELNEAVDSATPAADVPDNIEPIALQAYKSAVDDLLLLAAEALSLVPEVQSLQSSLRDAMKFARPLSDDQAPPETTRHLMLSRAMVPFHARMLRFLERKTTLSRKWVRCVGRIAAITDTEVMEIMTSAYYGSYQETRKTLE